MKTYLLVLFLCVSLSAFGQRYPTGKGTYRAGGGGSLSISDLGDMYAWRIQVTPRFGYFVTDRLLTGFTTNYIMEMDSFFSSAIKFTPLMKYYYPLNKNTFILANFEFGLDRATTFSDPKSIVDHSSTSFGPGVAYYFSRRVGFEINLLTQLYFEPDATHHNKIYTEGGVILNILNRNQKKDKPFKKDEEGFDVKPEDDE